MEEKDLAFLKTPTQDLVRALGAHAPHPSPDQLMTYVGDGELADEEAETIRAHLVVCLDCARTVLDLEQVARLELGDGGLETSGDAAPTEAAVDRVWRSLEQRLDLSDAPAPLRSETPRETASTGARSVVVPMPRTTAASGPPVVTGWRRSVLGIAAVLALAVVSGLLWNNLELRRQLAAGLQPRLNLAIVELDPVGSTQRSSESPQIAELGPDTAALVLVLPLVDVDPSGSYRVTLRDGGGGETLWTSDALVRSPQGLFTLELAADFLEEGTYSLEISGDGGSEILARYPLELRIP